VAAPLTAATGRLICLRVARGGGARDVPSLSDKTMGDDGLSRVAAALSQCHALEEVVYVYPTITCGSAAWPAALTLGIVPAAWPPASFTAMGKLSVKTYVQMMHVLEMHPNVHRLWSAAGSLRVAGLRRPEC